MTKQLIDNQRILASILGFAVGDALGVPVEFKKREALKKTPIIDMEEFGSHNQPKGTWSDDTSMMLATMDSIGEKDDIIFENIMNNYRKWLDEKSYTATNQVFDVGIGTKRAIEKYKNGYKAVKCGSSDYYNNGNGSLMRILPIALYASVNNYNEKEIVETLYYYSSMTHSHEISIMGCKIFCDYIKEIIEGNSPIEALENISNLDYDKYYDCSYQYNRILSKKIIGLKEEEIKSSGFIVDTLEATIWCIINSNSFEEAVLKAVNLGEDTDTIGALTGCLAGLIYGLESIPEKWINSLQNKELILKISEKYIRSLAKKK